MTTKRAIILAVVACGLLTGAVWARRSSSFGLRWHVVAGGGRDVVSTNYALRGTLGQVAIGAARATDGGLGAGYWYAADWRRSHGAYLPLTLRSGS